jgi:equilibrative nucleoside transporter 1/2/3
MVETKNNENAPDGGLKMEICFIIFGVGSLLAWNAILSDISFFMNYQGEYDPSTSFSFCNFVLNIIFQLIMIWKKQLLSYKVQLIFGLIASIISLVILPIVVISFEKNSLTGFILSAGIVLIQGLVNAFCSSGFFGLASFFPREMIISLSTGQGISGILMNIIGYIVLMAVNTGNEDDDAKLGAIIFFSISGLILLIALITLLIAFKTEYFRFYLGNTKEFENKLQKIENEIENQAITTTSTASQNNEELLVKEKQPEEEKKEKKEITFLEIFKRLYEIDLLSCFIYIITFALFPAVSISQRLFKTGKYRQITIITIYNVGDTIGRSIMSAITFTKNLAYIIICGRSILVLALILNFYFDMKLGMDPTLSSILLIVYVTILAITNGMGTTICLGLAPSMVPDAMKGRAGSSVSFFNILGIFLGTIVAFMTKYIINQIGEYVEED